MNHIRHDRQQEKHLFALYVAPLSSLVATVLPNESFIVSDEHIVHRMITVLRLKQSDDCIFFDYHLHVHCTIKTFIGKKQVVCTINSAKTNTPLSPSITFLLPILKRNDFENTLYSLTEVGVTIIQLLFTEKSHCSSFNQKDRERAQRIIIAAAEQSKNFAYPLLRAPISLSKMGNQYDASATKIFFDPIGAPLFSIVQSLHIDSPKDIVLLIGPEGDLSNEEKEIVASKNFTVCSLTPTVLRSTQAAALGAGLIRSLLV